jgi:hypothetical protein
MQCPSPRNRRRFASAWSKNGSGTGVGLHTEECNSVAAMTDQSVRPHEGFSCIDLLRRRLNGSKTSSYVICHAYREQPHRTTSDVACPPID